MSQTTLETASDLVVIELYDLTNKRLWFKNLSLASFNYDFTAIYNVGRNLAADYLGITDKNYKPLNNKYRLQLKFLVEDKSK